MSNTQPIEYIRPKQGPTVRISLWAFDGPAPIDADGGETDTANSVNAEFTRAFDPLTGRPLTDEEIVLLAEMLLERMTVSRLRDRGVFQKLTDVILLRMRFGGWLHPDGVPHP